MIQRLSPTQAHASVSGERRAIETNTDPIWTRRLDCDSVRLGWTRTEGERSRRVNRAAPASRGSRRVMDSTTDRHDNFGRDRGSEPGLEVEPAGSRPSTNPSAARQGGSASRVLATLTVPSWGADSQSSPVG